MLPSLVALASLFGTSPETLERPSYLFKMTEPVAPERGERYQPQPGDILLFDDHSALTAKIYRLVGTDGPLHAAVVFRKKDGSLGTLEAGTNAVMRVFNFDLEPRLHSFDGTILVRRLHQPMSEEQERRMAEFAVAQEGKSYAIGRLALQGTPFRPRGTFLAPVLGRTVVDRDRWICSELVVASLVVAGVFNVDDYPANMMYPRDLCYDERFDLSQHFAAPAMWYPRPELEYVGKGVRVGRDR
jgi:hypothetical protein